MKVGTTNPVELAIAASLLSGKLDTKDVATYAEKVGAALQVGDAVWQEAAAKWKDAAQTIKWRTDASKLVEANRDTLVRLADAVESIAQVTGARSESTNPALIDAFLVQHGVVGGQRAQSFSSLIGSQAFLDPGRYGALPDGTTAPVAIEVGKKRTASIPIGVDTSRLADPALKRLSEAMDGQWGFLHERAVEGFVNVNTLTRSTYNAYGVRQILQNLEDRDVKNARVLLVTGYETPIHELLESSRVKEVRVVDLSKAAAELVAKKYAHHPNASKLKVEVADFSGVNTDLQQRTMDALAPSAERGEAPPAGVVAEYFAETVQAKNQVALPWDSGSFDAVHLPFTLGAFDLGPITDAMVRHRKATGSGPIGYDDYLGKSLTTDAAARSTIANTEHVLAETSRITKKGGLVVANLWARPQADAPGKVRFSDTPISFAALDQMLAGFEPLFSGNPQPTLPKTVGHVIAKLV